MYRGDDLVFHFTVTRFNSPGESTFIIFSHDKQNMEGGAMVFLITCTFNYNIYLYKYRN